MKPIPNNPWIKEGLTREIRQYVQLSDNEKHHTSNFVSYSCDWFLQKKRCGLKC